MRWIDDQGVDDMNAGYKSLLLAAVSSAALLFSQPARAQSAAAAGPAQPAAAASDNGADDIIVTGSRVIKNGNAAPSPLTVLSSDELSARSPNNVAAALVQIPQFRGSVTPNGAVGFAGANRLGNYLNLRNLGVQRVLITLDGMRVQQTNTSGGVNIDLLPQALIQRVDVVTGGASAAYGSDAVAGVVNFVIDKRFVGLKGSATVGVSTYGDAISDKFTLAAGFSALSDRLHVEGSAEYNRSNGIIMPDRPWARTNYASVGAGSAASPLITVSNAHSNIATAGGLIIGGPLAGFAFGPDGTLHRADLGVSPGAGTISAGGEGGQYFDATIVGGSLNYQLFGRVGLDIAPDIEMYAQSFYTQANYQNQGISDFRFPNGPNTLTIFADNAFLPAVVKTALGTTPSFVLGRQNLEEGVAVNNFTTDAFNIQGGFNGKIGTNWRWDASYTWGKVVLDARVGDFNSQHLYAAADAVLNPANGQIVCRVTLTNPGLYPGCVPANFFGSGNESAAAVSYIRDISRYRIVNEQSVATASVSGSLFNVPAGAVSIALGASYRTASLAQTSNANPATPPDRTGLRGMPASALWYRITNTGVAAGSNNVKEGFAEIEVPIFKNAPFARSLNLNGAVRLTDYSTSGKATTWKAGISWEPTSTLRFRGTISRDIRAPTLNELFAGAQVLSQTLLDPHTLTQTSFFAVTRGNPNVKPEKAYTYTGGMIFKAPSFANLSISIDYYRIHISDVITTISNVTAVNQCEASNGTSPICANIIRPFPFSDRSPANAYTSVLVQPINLAQLTQSGIDIEASLAFRALGGELRLRTFGNILLHQITVDSPGAVALEAAGCCDNPKFSGTTTLDYLNGPWTAGLALRGFTGFKRSNTVVYANYGYEPAIAYLDARFSYDFGRDKQYQLSLNVQNLLNKSPPIVAGGGSNVNLMPPTDTFVYDTMGRYFTFSLKFKF